VKESHPQLSAFLNEAAQKVEVGAYYEHYKKLHYKVLMLALREEDNEPCVIYEAQYGDRIIFIRPVANWCEEVEVDGKIMPRFVKIN
jgi:hypothetical protein